MFSILPVLSSSHDLLQASRRDDSNQLHGLFGPNKQRADIPWFGGKYVLFVRLAFLVTVSLSTCWQPSVSSN